MKKSDIVIYTVTLIFVSVFSILSYQIIKNYRDNAQAARESEQAEACLAEMSEFTQMIIQAFCSDDFDTLSANLRQEESPVTLEAFRGLSLTCVDLVEHLDATNLDNPIGWYTIGFEINGSITEAFHQEAQSISEEFLKGIEESNCFQITFMVAKSEERWYFSNPTISNITISEFVPEN